MEGLSWLSTQEMEPGVATHAKASTGVSRPEEERRLSDGPRRRAATVSWADACRARPAPLPFARASGRGFSLSIAVAASAGDPPFGTGIDSSTEVRECHWYVFGAA